MKENLIKMSEFRDRAEKAENLLARANARLEMWEESAKDFRCSLDIPIFEDGKFKKEGFDIFSNCVKDVLKRQTELIINKSK